MCAGPACGSGREGTAAAGGGEGEGGVAAEGPGPHYCPAGEGQDDPDPPTRTGALPGNGISNVAVFRIKTYYYLKMRGSCSASHVQQGNSLHATCVKKSGR